MLSERDPATGRPVLPWMRHVFLERGVWLRNFYSRGLSLSVPSWAILDTGHPTPIRGNVEYDRYTLRAFDYLNFIPFYFRFAFSKTVDMPGVELLDDLGIPLIADRFGSGLQAHQSFQLYQRGIRWDTLQRAARSPFPLTSPRDLLDEWQAGFEMSRGLREEIERDLIRTLADPGILYLDLFTGDFDHIGHLDNSEKAQRAVVSEIDALVGRVWSAVEKSPLAASTVFALVSDHGMNTTPAGYSQGYNLVDLLRSPAGGGHHVVTNRHPLSEYKLRGLYPFVHKVFIASESSPYGRVSPKDYPTALLDLDGNERASIYLRNSDLNLIHLLLIQLERPLAPEMRKAVLAACRSAMDRYRRNAHKTRTLLTPELTSLEQQIATTHLPPKDGSLETRRKKAHLSSWKADVIAYRQMFDALNRFEQLDLAKPHAAAVPKHLLGERNSVQQLQNYVVDIAPGGLRLTPEGKLDESVSFRRIDYFELITGLTVKNVVQEGVGNRPVDFIAVDLPPDSPSTESAVWLYTAPDRQMLLRRSRDNRIQMQPVANLRQDGNGRITFDTQPWRDGLPLALREDEKFAVPQAARDQWLSQWHTEQEWFRATHRARYSNGVIGLLAHFGDSERERKHDGVAPDFHWSRRELVRPDLLLLAHDRWNFNVRGFNPGGNHGSFFRISTHAVLMIAGGAQSGVSAGVAIDEPYDSLSFAPTVLSLTGRCDPKLPGPVIAASGAAPCSKR